MFYTIFKPHQPLHIVTKGYAYNYYAHPTCPIVIEPNCTLGWVADAPKPRNSCSAPQSSTPHDAKIWKIKSIMKLQLVEMSFK